jgi:ribose-phosphate pyrophosphokinase
VLRKILSHPQLVANSSSAVIPYFPYSRQSKKKSHRGAITARMVANLLDVAGVKHVITVDLHASQMQGFFKCPVDNLHAEPIIAKWIRRNVPNWKEAVVVSKNAGGTKRVTSLADALKLNFGIVTTDRRRTTNLTASMIMAHLDGVERQPALESNTRLARIHKNGRSSESERTVPRRPIADSSGSPTRPAGESRRASRAHTPIQETTQTPPRRSPEPSVNGDDEFNDRRAQEVTHARLVQGHIVEDDFDSPTTSAVENSVQGDDPMAMSYSSLFVPERQSLGGSGDAMGSSDEEDNALQNPKLEHMITLVGDVKNRTVFIVDDMIDKPGSWIAAAETVVKRGFAKKVYCIATHGVFGGDCLEQLQACACIDTVVVTNSFPISVERAKNNSKLVVLDLSFLLAEAIRRNHYGESISPLFQHHED